MVALYLVTDIGQEFLVSYMVQDSGTNCGLWDGLYSCVIVLVLN
jgi:hypothetical protein